MYIISSTLFALTLARQQRLTDAEWLQRCDELALQQRVLFMELLTFRRDGLNPDAARALIDYLSVLQAVAEIDSTHASAPVEMPEFQSAMKHMLQLYSAMSNDDRPHYLRMIQAWHDGIVAHSDTIVWSGCIETLQQHGIMTSPLMGDVIITLTSIAEVYSRRFTKGYRATSP